MTTTERIVEAIKKECPAIFNMGDFEPLITTAIASVIGKERPTIDEMAEAMREFCERVEKVKYVALRHTINSKQSSRI